MEKKDIAFLETLTKDVVAGSRVQPGEKVGLYGPNTSRGILIRPGSRDCYPAFWIRDYVLSLDSGAISLEEEMHALKFTICHQAMDDWRTYGGGFVPRGSIPDHITLDGQAIFYPGTLDDAAHQGGVWGPLPPFDNAFFLIEMSWRLSVLHEEPQALDFLCESLSLLDRLHIAFNSVPADPATGLVTCQDANRGVSFGFTDTVIHTGHLLFASILRWKAALQMSELFPLMGLDWKAENYLKIAEKIRTNLPATFNHKSGLFKASTESSNQPDVWGSAFAVYSGILDIKNSQRICESLAFLYRQGLIAWKGAIRHVPVGMDFDETTCWERVVRGFYKNRYQNGAYWSMPTGWVAHALAQVDPRAAENLIGEFIAELKEGDFRQGEEYGSPWECQHPEGKHQQNPVYMASVTVPYAVLRKMISSSTAPS
jgi:hypothetical protein